MTHQVLARKWRPRDFESLVGQEHVVRALTHALTSGRLHHAYLFTGTRGVGKTTIARILAKSLNCETGLTARPCGVCRACTEIDGGRFVDYIEMDAASNRGVDEMTQVLENAVYAPTAARFKVYVIDEVHMLSTHAFNAMLKTLEEPPEHVVFVLATTDPQKVPVTVLSRCLQFNLKNMTPAAIADHLGKVLQAEAIDFEGQALPLIGRAAGGSMRDALSLLDQAIAYGGGQVGLAAVREMLGVVDSRYLEQLLEALVAGDGARLVAVADQMQAGNAPFERVLQDFAALLQRIALAQIGVVADEAQAGQLNDFASRIAAEDLQVYYQIALHGARDLPLSLDPLSGFTMVLLRLLAFRPDPSGASGRSGADPATNARSAPAARVAGAAAPESGALEAPRSAGSQADGAPAAVQSARAAAIAAAAAAARGAGGRPGTGRAAASDPQAMRKTEPRLPAAPPRGTPAQAMRADVTPAIAAAADVTPIPGAPAKALPAQEPPAPGPLVQSASVQETSDRDLPAREQPVQEPSVHDTLAPSSASIDFDGDWPALAARLPVTGLAQQLVRQSELVGFDGTGFRIRVPVKALAEPVSTGKVRDALSGLFGTPVRLTVDVGGVTGQTAAAVATQQHAERLAQARAAIDADPFVQTLISEFGARVVPDSIRPVDRPGDAG